MMGTAGEGGAEARKARKPSKIFLFLLAVLFIVCSIIAVQRWPRTTMGPTVRGDPFCAHCTIRAAAASLPELQREIDKVLTDSNASTNDIDCSGHMLGRHWEHLSYGEVMPFYCKVGDRMLFVDGGNHYLDGAGKRLDSWDQPMFDNAVAVEHPAIHWKWLAPRPVDNTSQK
jgi:hypothetical protein